MAGGRLGGVPCSGRIVMLSRFTRSRTAMARVIASGPCNVIRSTPQSCETKMMTASRDIRYFSATAIAHVRELDIRRGIGLTGSRAARRFELYDMNHESADPVVRNRGIYQTTIRTASVRSCTRAVTKIARFLPVFFLFSCVPDSSLPSPRTPRPPRERSSLGRCQSG